MKYLKNIVALINTLMGLMIAGFLTHFNHLFLQARGIDLLIDIRTSEGKNYTTMWDNMRNCQNDILGDPENQFDGVRIDIGPTCFSHFHFLGRALYRVPVDPHGCSSTRPRRSPRFP